ncbi:MAG: alanine racemase [Lachnospiraceae bacterium]|nr:alanine racemase [Lachnospiraceae bacterium]
MKPEEYDQIKRGYALIDLDAVRYNVDSMFSNIAQGTKMVLVIKTDGYGHGAVPIAKLYDDDERIWGYAVACPEEAYDLRDHGINKPVLILGYTFDYSYDDLVRLDIRPAVFEEEMIQKLSETAKKQGKKAYVHIKVDTGMSRIGIKPDESGLEFVKKIIDDPNLEAEGIFTHFARADEKDKKFALKQLSVFKSFTERLQKETGVCIPLRHCSNSAGIIELSEANMDMVRAGITLYGLWPSDEVVHDIVDIRPVMSLRSHIVYIKEVEPGTQISYGGTYVAPDKRIIATVPLGYGDGYPRLLSGKGEVIVKGKRVPICGRVCMDQFMIDVSDIPDVKKGDMVTLIGKDADECITMEEIGTVSGRFNYETACNIGKRVPRVYISDGEVRDIILDRISIK